MSKSNVRPDGGRRTSSAATEFMRPDRGRQPLGCWDADPELFFPINEHDPDIPATKAMCRACPAVVECGARAEQENYDHGTWGGLTEWERRAARRKRNRTLSSVGGAA